MSTNAFPNEHENDVLLPYKDPISAKVIAGLAIFWLVIGVLALAIGVYFFISISSNKVYTTDNPTLALLASTSIFTFIAIVLGCFITSAIFFVIYNVACDIHRTEYNLHVLLNRNQVNHKQLLKQMKYIDDSIARQSSVIIQKSGSNQSYTPERSKPQREFHTHDGAF